MDCVKETEHSTHLMKIVLLTIVILKYAGETKGHVLPDCSPCECNPFRKNGVIMNCDITNQSQLIEANYNANGIHFSVYVLIAYRLGSIDENTFGNNTIKNLVFYNTVVDEFHLFSALHGMRDTLFQLYFNNVTVGRWFLSTGEGFHRLRKFQLSNCHPTQPRWSQLSDILNVYPRSLSSVIIEYCELEPEVLMAISRFTSLTEIKLAYNSLTSVNRNYFPRPAPYLKSLKLSSNPITFLPDNMFEDMPALKKLNINDLHLKVLHQHIFKPIFAQLEEIKIYGILLRCDCNLAWLLTRKDSLGTERNRCIFRESIFGYEFRYINYLAENCTETLDYNVTNADLTTGITEGGE